MISKKVNFRRFPTSELIFNTLYPSNNIEVVENIAHLEKILYSRLEKKYKLDYKESKNFIEEEKYIITTRGSSIDNYLFGKAKTVEETLKMFYEIENRIEMIVKNKEHFNKFTFSEIAFLANLFLVFENRLNERFEKLKSLEKKELNKNKSKLLIEQAELEYKLSNYYGLLKRCMLSKLVDKLEYKNISEFKKLSLIMKESLCFNRETSLYQKFFVNYKDLSKNIFEENKQLTKSLGADAYIFREK